MRVLELIVDDVSLPVENSRRFPLSLVFNIEEKTDPSKIRGSFSKRTTNVPATKEVQEVFGHWDDTRSDAFGRGDFLPLIVRVDGNSILQGRALVQKVERQGGVHRKKPVRYKLGLYGNNADWFSVISNILLRDLDFGTHTLSNATVEDGSGATYDANDEFGYYLPQIGSSFPGGSSVTYMDHRPFVFLRDTLEKIFQAAGYILQSEFLDTEFFKRLILPLEFTNYSLDWKINNSNVWAIKDTPQGPIGLIDTTVTFDSVEYNGVGANWDGATYTCPYPGIIYPACVLYGIVDPLGPPEIIQIPEIFKNGVSVGLAFGGPVSVVAGDLLEFRYSAQQPLGTETINRGFGVFAWEPTFIPGTPIPIPELFGRTWKCSDVVQGVTQMFGLVWDTNVETGVIRVEPRDNYTARVKTFNGSSWVSSPENNEGFFRDDETVDWTPKLDLSREAELENDIRINKVVRMAYKQDGDERFEGSQKREDLKIYEAFFTMDGEKHKAGESKTTNQFFTQTFHATNSNVTHEDSSITPQFPTVSLAEENEDVKPRVLFFAGRRDGLDGLIELAGVGSYDFPAAFMVNYNDTTGGDPCLSFGNETALDGTVLVGLMQGFFLQYLKRLEVSKLLTDFFLIDDLDILNLDFRQKRIVEGSKFILETIDGYKPLIEESTSCELLLDVEPDEDDANKITSASIDGLATTII